MGIANKFFLGLPLENNLGSLLGYLSTLGMLVVVSTVVYFVLLRLSHKIVLSKLKEKYGKNNLTIYIEENKLFRVVLLFFPPAFIGFFIPVAEANFHLGEWQWVASVVDKILISYTLVLLAILLNKAIDFGEAVYNQFPVSKKWPIRSYAQFVKIVSFIIFAIIIISSLLNKSPLAFFTGLGAMMAIISLVFKDSILSFISSIQLSASSMMQVGHWIEIPNENISGTIIEMSLNTIKIQNFDNTISTVPPYFLTSHIVKNWQGMTDSGGRRFKKILPFNLNTIMPLNENILSELAKKSLLREYIEKNKEDLLERGSNLQLFRVYAQAVLDNDDRIHKGNFTCLVRELSPSAQQGAPVEIYAFTKTVNWKSYESISADIMDHLASQAGDFSLKFLQRKM